MRVAPLAPTDDPTALLAAACPYDRAERVAAEKLFGPAPEAPPPRAFGAWSGGALVGVAASCGDRLRLLAVAPEARGHGIGTALLDACLAAARADGAARLRTLDQPGNYLAPGVDLRHTDALGWLARRGFAPVPGPPRVNLRIAVRDNPRVTAALAAELADRADYAIRRAAPDEPGLLAAIAAAFGGAWPFEVARAQAGGGVHVALDASGACCAFAAHDGNNRGLGWFGPTGTWPAHRGRGLGEALLLACLVDVAADHDHCEIAWIGPRTFYDRVAGIAGERQFVVLSRAT